MITSIASSSEGNSYAIESQGKTLLIDCGIPLKRISKVTKGFSNVVGCLTSHEHGDHSSHLKALEKSTNVPIFCTQGTKERYSLSNTVHCIHHMQQIDLNPFKIVFLELEHDVECFGFLIMTKTDKLFYATDTVSVKYTFPRLTKLMIEANYDFNLMVKSDMNKAVVKRSLESHLSIDKSMEFISRHPELDEIHLLHLSDSHSDAGLFQRMVEDQTGIPVYVAEK